MTIRLAKCCQPVHPRTHGEHGVEMPNLPVYYRFIPARTGNTLIQHVTAADEGGSSPHARGTRPAAKRTGCFPRFIPARTGNTAVTGSRRRPPAVHPRTHGEHGNQQHHLPASAAVHPRTHGEHAPPQSLMICKTGSSPHARGTRGKESGAGVVQRFIPARTGNTRRQFNAVKDEQVHPRTHGEHWASIHQASCPTGSSPHARGTRRIRA